MEITGAGGELQIAPSMRRRAVRPRGGRKARDECIKESRSGKSHSSGASPVLGTTAAWKHWWKQSQGAGGEWGRGISFPRRQRAGASSVAEFLDGGKSRVWRPSRCVQYLWIPASHCLPAPCSYCLCRGCKQAQRPSSSSSCSHTSIATMSFGGQTPTIVVLREGR